MQNSCGVLQEKRLVLLFEGLLIWIRPVLHGLDDLGGSVIHRVLQLVISSRFEQEVVWARSLLLGRKTPLWFQSSRLFWWSLLFWLEWGLIWSLICSNLMRPPSNLNLSYSPRRWEFDNLMVRRWNSPNIGSMVYRRWHYNLMVHRLFETSCGCLSLLNKQQGWSPLAFVCVLHWTQLGWWISSLFFISGYVFPSRYLEKSH